MLCAWDPAGPHGEKYRKDILETVLEVRVREVV
jgi:hypothetical protein